METRRTHQHYRMLPAALKYWEQFDRDARNKRPDRFIASSPSAPASPPPAPSPAPNGNDSPSKSDIPATSPRSGGSIWKVTALWFSGVLAGMLLATGAVAQSLRSNVPVSQAIIDNQRHVFTDRLNTITFNVDIQDERGNTPMHWAAIMNKPWAMRALIARAADPTIKNKDGRTPKNLASGSVSTMLSQYKFTGCTSIVDAFTAPTMKQRTKIDRCISQGSVYDKGGIYSKHPGYTALHFAVMEDWRDIFIQRLIDAGLSIDAKDWNGMTPLMLLARRGQDDFTRKLISTFGADPDVRDRTNRSAADYVPAGKPELEAFLRDAMKGRSGASASAGGASSARDDVVKSCNVRSVISAIKHGTDAQAAAEVDLCHWQLSSGMDYLHLALTQNDHKPRTIRALIPKAGSYGSYHITTAIEHAHPIATIKLLIDMNQGMVFQAQRIAARQAIQGKTRISDWGGKYQGQYHKAGKLMALLDAGSAKTKEMMDAARARQQAEGASGAVNTGAQCDLYRAVKDVLKEGHDKTEYPQRMSVLSDLLASPKYKDKVGRPSCNTDPAHLLFALQGYGNGPGDQEMDGESIDARVYVAIKLIDAGADPDVTNHINRTFRASKQCDLTFKPFTDKAICKAIARYDERQKIIPPNVTVESSRRIGDGGVMIAFRVKLASEAKAAAKVTIAEDIEGVSVYPEELDFDTHDWDAWKYVRVKLDNWSSDGLTAETNKFSLQAMTGTKFSDIKDIQFVLNLSNTDGTEGGPNGWDAQPIGYPPTSEKFIRVGDNDALDLHGTFATYIDEDWDAVNFTEETNVAMTDTTASCTSGICTIQAMCLVKQDGGGTNTQFPFGIQALKAYLLSSNTVGCEAMVSGGTLTLREMTDTEKAALGR